MLVLNVMQLVQRFIRIKKDLVAEKWRELKILLPILLDWLQSLVDTVRILLVWITVLTMFFLWIQKLVLSLQMMKIVSDVRFVLLYVHLMYLSFQMKKIVKCDGCNDRVKAGLLPACVEACESHALRLIDCK